MSADEDFKPMTVGDDGSGSGSELSDLLCGCGRQATYQTQSGMACNKYARCMSYQEQYEKIIAIDNERAKYKAALEKIVNVNGMDYEYKAWAKAALAT